MPNEHISSSPSPSPSSSSTSPALISVWILFVYVDVPGCCFRVQLYFKLMKFFRGIQLCLLFELLGI